MEIGYIDSFRFIETKATTPEIKVLKNNFGTYKQSIRGNKPSWK